MLCAQVVRPLERRRGQEKQPLIPRERSSFIQLAALLVSALGGCALPVTGGRGSEATTGDVRHTPTAAFPPEVRMPRSAAGTPEHRAFQRVAELREEYSKRNEERCRELDRLRHRLAALGPRAAPVLFEHLVNPNTFPGSPEQHQDFRDHLARALAEVGSPGVDYLIQAAHRESYAIRRTAEEAVAHSGPAADMAAPLLAQLVSRRAGWDCESLIEVFGRTGPAASRTWPALAFALNDSDWLVRRAALRSLERIGPDARPAAPDLVLFLKDIDPQTRWLAVCALASIDPGSARNKVRPVLVELVGDESAATSTRAGAAEMLGRMLEPSDPAVAALRAVLAYRVNALLDLEAAQLRCNAAWALGRMGPAAAGARPQLLQMANDRFDAVRQAAVAALDRTDGEIHKSAARGGVQLSPPRPPKASPPLPRPEDWDSEAIQEETRRLVGQLSAAARRPMPRPDYDRVSQLRDELAEMKGAAVPALVEALRYDHVSVRRDAAYVLGNMGEGCHDAWPTLIHAVTWGDVFVQRGATEALENSGVLCVTAVPGLIEIVLSHMEDGPANAASRILVKTAQRYPEVTLLHLRRGLHRGAPHLYRLPRRVLAKLGPLAAPAVPELRELLERGDLSEQEAAAEALAMIGPAAKDTVQTLKNVQNRVQNVEKAIAEALKQIEERNK